MIVNRMEIKNKFKISINYKLEISNNNNNNNNNNQKNNKYNNNNLILNNKHSINNSSYIFNKVSNNLLKVMELDLNKHNHHKKNPFRNLICKNNKILIIVTEL